MNEGKNERTGNTKPTIEDKKLKFEKYKYNVEIVKWFIVSVALVIVSLIVDQGFKERSAGVQEMQAYDKYVGVILKANNIEERWKLSEYFSIVTPTDRLRERWLAYNDSISSDYFLYKKLMEEQQQLLLKDSMTTEESKLLDVQKKIENYSYKLVGSTPKRDLQSAQYWEEKGFEYLKGKDVNNAIKSFQNSENAYNRYHQVYEIAKYLKENRQELENKKSGLWISVYKKIAKDYSWGMPDKVKSQLTPVKPK